MRRTRGAKWRQGPRGGGGVLRLRAVEGGDRGEVKGVAMKRTAKRWVLVVAVVVVWILKNGAVSARYLLMSGQVRLTGMPSVVTPQLPNKGYNTFLYIKEGNWNQHNPPKRDGIVGAERKGDMDAIARGGGGSVVGHRDGGCVYQNARSRRKNEFSRIHTGTILFVVRVLVMVHVCSTLSSSCLLVHCGHLNKGVAYIPYRIQQNIVSKNTGIVIDVEFILHCDTIYLDTIRERVTRTRGPPEVTRGAPVQPLWC